MRRYSWTAVMLLAIMHCAVMKVSASEFNCDSCDKSCASGSVADGCDVGIHERNFYDEACGCDDSRSQSGCLGCLNLSRLIKPSDHCFDDFISPMIDPVFIEDPRNLTELRPIFIQHRFPPTVGPANIPAGGDAQLYAIQFRLALTDRLSLIAVKDGYIVDGSGGALDGLLDSGWADVSAGLKYNLIRSSQTGTLAAAGFTDEIPIGSENALQTSRQCMIAGAKFPF